MKGVFLGGYRLIAKLQRDQVRDSYLARRADPVRPQEIVVLTRLRNARGPHNELLALRAELPPDVDLIPLLEHPNIVATHEFSHGLTPYWVTEYIEGQTLDRVLEAVSPYGGFPITFALHVLCRVLAALEYAHNLDAAGEQFTIVHGDVRLENVYITYQGEVKLAGFGVPRVPRVEPKSHAEPDEPVPFAPRRVDRGADIYATGLLMRQLLSQRLRATLEAVFPVESLPRSSASDAQIMQALTPICERALERDPELRYATAEEMQSDLLEVIERLNGADNSAASDPTASLRLFVQQLFERERRDCSRRISLLVAIDDSLAQTGEREEHGRDFVTGHFRLPTFLRLAPPTRDEPLDPAPRTATASHFPHARDSVAPAALPHSRPPTFDAHSSAPAPRDWTGARVPIVLSAGVVVGLIVGVWSFSTTDPPSKTASAAALHTTDPATVLRLCGSNTVGAELAPALVEALFASKNNATKVAHEHTRDSSSARIRAVVDDQELTAEITARGTATGFVGLGDGSCDIAMASRPVHAAEAAQLVAKGLGDLTSPANEHVIALDGVALIVHPDNPVSALDRASLRDVFTGRIKKWSALNGSDRDIHVLARDDKSGTHDTFQQLILGAEKLSPNAARYASNAALADAVALDPAAIGFVGLAYVRSAKPLAVSDAGAAPRLPTPFTVATESYLLTRRLYFYSTNEPRNPWVSELVNFALSPAGQAIAKKAGFIDLTLVVDSSHCSECSSRYRTVTANAVRASVDIRFRSGSIEPDSRARRDLNRLVSLLNEYRQSKVLLLGFSDGIGDPSENLELSYKRANVVAEELAVRGIQVPVVLGFGSEMPVSSNDTPEGRDRNRRVEVWLKQR